MKMHSETRLYTIDQSPFISLLENTVTSGRKKCLWINYFTVWLRLNSGRMLQKTATVFIITTTSYCPRYTPYSRLRVSPFFQFFPLQHSASTEFPPILLCVSHLQSHLQVILTFGHISRIIVKDGMMMVMENPSSSRENPVPTSKMTSVTQ